MIASIIEHTVRRACEKASPARELRRALATMPEASASTSASSSTPYSFSSRVKFPESVSTHSHPLPSQLTNPKNGKSIIDHINTQLRETYDPAQLCKTLLSRRHPTQRLLPGSIVSIVSYTNPTKTTTSVFSGVLMGIRRRGVDTSFRVRNILNKIGVEMNYKAYSPMIKEIQVIKQADGKQGNKRMNRAKLYYLRDKPQIMEKIASAVKQK